MNAKKCDRCGQAYDPYEGVIYGELKINNIRLYQELNGTNWYRDAKDLCPECTEKLVKWLTNPNADDTPIN